MDAYTILLLGGVAAIWTLMLSAVFTYAKHNARGLVRAEGLEPPRAEAHELLRLARLANFATPASRQRTSV